MNGARHAPGRGGQIVDRLRNGLAFHDETRAAVRIVVCRAMPIVRPVAKIMSGKLEDALRWAMLMTTL